MSGDDTNEDEPTPEDSSLAVSVGELLESVHSEIEHEEQDEAPAPEPSDSKPPPLPASDPEGIDESLAVSVDDLLASVSDEVSQLEPGPARPLRPQGAFVLLQHADLGLARFFYEQRLGFEVLEADEMMVRLRVRGLSLILTTAETGAPPPGEGIVMRINVDDLGKAYGTLMTTEVEIVTPPTERPWGDHEMVVADPTGYRVALVG